MAKRRKKVQTVEAPPVPRGGPRFEYTPWTDLIGHAGPRETIEASLRSGRLHHAWIFHGPRGVGKFTAALGLAGVLLDPTSAPDLSGSFAPDPDSPTQELLRAGSHPDLHVVTKELSVFSSHPSVRTGKQRNIPIGVLREFLIDPAARSRVRSGDSLAGKVLIVDEAHLLDQNGQNAVLKTLEEPAEGTVLILVTENEDKLLPTIRSRCQRVVFSPLADADLRRWLARPGVQDRLGEVGELPAWIEAFAEGSPGAILEAVEGGLAGWHARLGGWFEELPRGTAPGPLGVAMTECVSEQAEARVKASPLASKEAANLAAGGMLFRYLASGCRSKLRAARDADEAAAWASAIEAIRHAERRLGTNVQMAFVAEALIVEMTRAFGREPVRA